LTFSKFLDEVSLVLSLLWTWALRINIKPVSTTDLQITCCSNQSSFALVVEYHNDHRLLILLVTTDHMCHQCSSSKSLQVENFPSKEGSQTVKKKFPSSIKNSADIIRNRQNNLSFSSHPASSSCDRFFFCAPFSSVVSRFYNTFMRNKNSEKLEKATTTRRRKRFLNKKRKNEKTKQVS
jgi:hypothetical protein